MKVCPSKHLKCFVVLRQGWWGEEERGGAGCLPTPEQAFISLGQSSSRQVTFNCDLLYIPAPPNCCETAGADFSCQVEVGRQIMGVLSFSEAKFSVITSVFSTAHPTRLFAHKLWMLLVSQPSPACFFLVFLCNACLKSAAPC